jgi:hypothetical protein
MQARHFWQFLAEEKANNFSWKNPFSIVQDHKIK